MTALRRLKRTAHLIQTLVFYDEPQLALLQDDRARKLIAVAVEREGLKQAFHACETHSKLLSRYMDEKVDLNFVFRDAGVTQHYFFDWHQFDGMDVPLYRMPRDEVNNSTYYPKPGFFSRNHTHVYRPESAAASSEKHVYKIDGSWEASDFSRFYSKIADLYAFVSIIGRIADQLVGASDKAFFKSKVLQRLWRGGGSYVGFYDDISARIQSLVPLKVSRIQWASPGVVEMSGEQQIFSELDRTMELFDFMSEELANQYSLLYSALRQDKLLSASKGATFTSDAKHEYVLIQSRNFAKQMQIPDVNALYDACDNNTVLFCKLLLSYYRRARELHSFRAEGRVQASSGSTLA